MLPEQKNELRVDLVELAEACPYDNCNPEDCPLFALRKLPVADRMRWVNALTDKDLVYLSTYHYVCLDTKLSKADLPKPKGDKRRRSIGPEPPARETQRKARTQKHAGTSRRARSAEQ
jgi:hypothetical protein